MTVGKQILYLIKGLFFPLTGLFVFDVSHGDFIKLCLAQIVKQTAESKTLFIIARFQIALGQNLIDHQTVVYKSAGKCAVETGACRGGKEIRPLQPFQKSSAAITADLFPENCQKPFLQFLRIHDTVTPFLLCQDKYALLRIPYRLPPSPD